MSFHKSKENHWLICNIGIFSARGEWVWPKLPNFNSLEIQLLINEFEHRVGGVQVSVGDLDLQHDKGRALPPIDSGYSPVDKDRVRTQS